MKKDAIIIELEEIYEVRCSNCGKLLFTIKKIENDVAKRNKSVIITVRCTRSKCNTDNKVVI